MAFVYESSMNYTSSKADIALGVKLSNGHSLFNSIYTIPEQATENLKTLLLTRKGERYMQPDFGTDLLTAVFQPNVVELKDDIQDLINSAVSYWLPYINIQNINVITQEDDPVLLYNVEIHITYTVQSFSTNTIKIFVSDNNVTIS